MSKLGGTSGSSSGGDAGGGSGGGGGSNRFSSPVFWQVQYIVSNSLVPKKSYASALAELQDLVRLYGEDVRLFLISCLVDAVAGLKGPPSKLDHDHRVQLLTQELAVLGDGPHFGNVIAEALTQAREGGDGGCGWGVGVGGRPTSCRQRQDRE